MRITKEAGAGAGHAPDGKELEQINRFSRKKLTAEEVYTFSVRLCDNEVDRDGERFGRAALEELGRLFTGKSGVFDHQWSARGQTARIYRTEVVEENSLSTAAGEPYCYLKGYAYMLRTEGNRELIAEIEGGIKKEVSVGCAVSRAVCSICGEDYGGEKCSHVKGRRYNGKLCWAELTGVTDAYEWSFVAVPAQKRAGVMKQMGGKTMTLKEFLGDKPEYLGEIEGLEKAAELGRRYLAGLRREVARLGGLAAPELRTETLEKIAGKLDEEELLELKRAYEAQVERQFPAETQLNYRGGTEPAGERDGAFLV